MRDILDLNNPFYRPLFLRIAVVAVCFGWATVETLWGSDFFAVLLFGLSGYSAYRFFVVFAPRDRAERSDDDAAKGD